MMTMTMTRRKSYRSDEREDSDLHGERLLREVVLVETLHAVENGGGTDAHEEGPPVERVDEVGEEEAADDLHEHLVGAGDAEEVLQLGAADIEGGGGGEGGDDGLGEETRDHTAVTDAQKEVDDATFQTQGRDCGHVLVRRLVGVHEGESAADHHGDEGEGTDVHLAGRSQQTIHEHWNDTAIETVDGREVGKHGVRHSLECMQIVIPTWGMAITPTVRPAVRSNEKYSFL